MANVIPMAGLGSRFATEGYRLPKPLIPVSGEPMIVNVIRDLPESDNWVFIVRERHIREYDIDTLLRSEVPSAKVVTVAEQTEGQVCTAMLAEPHLDPDEEVLIAACDHGILYDSSEFQNLRSRDDVDAIVWTFTEQQALAQSPESWGWCVLNDDERTIVDVSVKSPISEDPYHDHAITGAFYFDRATDFLEAAESMIDANHRINDEFYVDPVPVFLRRMDKRSVIFDVDLYISWGTPRDLYRYEEMEYLCEHDAKPTEQTEKRHLWEAYFDD
jgi:NDP-sugar pyrophosphorylase family protein